jgi:hypothetical protein
MEADNQVRGYQNYIRQSQPTKELALKMWAEHCRKHHGTP